MIWALRRKTWSDLSAKYVFFQSIQGFQPQNKEHRILNIIKGNVPSKIVASRDSKELVTTS